MKDTEKRVMALGFFDGVHLGHGSLLRRVRTLAEQYGCKAAAMTFDRNPGKSGKLLTSVHDRRELICRLYAIDQVFCLAFDDTLLHTPWDEFVRNQLVSAANVRHVVCGYDYRFGYRGEGTPEKLAALCCKLGIGCDIMNRLELDGITVSSTLIRQLVADGEMEKAARFLGHPYQLSGTVIHGRQLGRSIGIPTANLMPAPELLLPSNGVYAVKATVDGAVYTGVCNVGNRPTVDGKNLLVETWISDYTEDLYGKELRLEFYKKLRSERRFSSVTELQQEIFRNRIQMQEYFGQP